MVTPIIISKKSRDQNLGKKDFPFTQQDIPGINHRTARTSFLTDLRLKSWEIYRQLPMPTTSDEAWRRTDIKALRTETLTLKQDQVRDLPPRTLLKPLVGKNHAGQIILTPGKQVRIDSNPALDELGVVFTDLHTAEKEHTSFLAQSLGQIVKPEDGKFSALASAFAEDGIIVYVPRGVHIKEPLHGVIWSPGKNIARFTRLLLWLDNDSELTFVYEAASPSQTEGQSMHAGIVEIYVGENSHLTFVEMQSWGRDVWNFSHERARVDRDGKLDWIFGAVGSNLTKNFSEIDLIGQGATAKMSGFYFTDGKQHLDHDTQQNHLAPHTTSDLLFKGALKDQSRSVWQGMIYVAPGAQKTDGYQANRNLTLSSQARADSIPGLEILANDVRCTHGATVGKIDEEQLFYLLSRGIALNDAIRLIVEGFFEPIMERIPFEGVKNRFRSSIRQKIG